jgi:hypothetical protein
MLWRWPAGGMEKMKSAVVCCRREHAGTIMPATEGSIFIWTEPSERQEQSQRKRGIRPNNAFVPFNQKKSDHLI